METQAAFVPPFVNFSVPDEMAPPIGPSLAKTVDEEYFRGKSVRIMKYREKLFSLEKFISMFYTYFCASLISP
jgi:hypothetical protein